MRGMRGVKMELWDNGTVRAITCAFEQLQFYRLEFTVL